jgi:DsbC/DsbD-like thiol-disulfide interchange protein
MFRSSLALCAFALFAAIACDRSQPVAPGERPQYSQTKEAKPSSAVASASENAKTRDAPPQVTMEEPDSRSPVNAAAALQPARAMKGKSFVLVVKIKIAPTWHIYAADGMVGSSIPTSLKLELPQGVEAAGEWTLPSARQDGESRIYEGSLQFSRQLRIGSQVKPGPIHVRCELTYQACDPFSCRAPAKKTLQADAVIEPTP